MPAERRELANLMVRSAAGETATICKGGFPVGEGAMYVRYFYRGQLAEVIPPYTATAAEVLAAIKKACDAEDARKAAEAAARDKALGDLVTWMKAKASAIATGKATDASVKAELAARTDIEVKSAAVI